LKYPINPEDKIFKLKEKKRLFEKYIVDKIIKPIIGVSKNLVMPTK